MTCPKCGNDAPPDAQFCPACGERLTPLIPTIPAPVTARRGMPIFPIVAGVVVLLLGVSGWALWRLARGGGDTEGRTATVSVTVDGKTVAVEKTVSRPQDLSDELAPDTIRGRVVDTGWRKFVVKSQETGKVYVVHVGRSTAYSPDRYPKVGETVRVKYHLRRGSVIGDRLTLE